MQTKACRKCGEQKPLDQFSRKASAKDGLQHKCKSCESETRKLWRENNIDRDTASKAAYYAEHRSALCQHRAQYRKEKSEAIRAKQDAWKAVNLDKVRGYALAYYKANKDKYNARKAMREAAKIRAAIGWDEELDALVLTEAAHLARIRSETLAVEHHVDHVIPLRSAKVCGLHNAYNLAVIPAVENMSKGNRWWPDMP